jgi:hypothetical protein
LGVLTELVPPELVGEVLSATRCGHRRLRLLPAPVVLYFVLAMTLFPGRGYLGVWSALVAGLDLDERHEPSASALRQARVRLGSAPVRVLFDRVRGVLGTPDTPGVFYRGLRTVAWDGTMLDAPDSESNRAHYPPVTNQKGRCGFAKIRLMALVECGTRAIVQAAFAPRFTSEHQLARRLLHALQPGMLLLADRNFFGFPLWQAAASTGAHLLWRVKSDTLLPRLSALGDGSYLSRIAVSKNRRASLGTAELTVRVVEAAVTVTAADGTRRTELYRFATTLLDADTFPARELAALYARRWEIESAYAALKTTQRGPGRVLRSRNPHGIEQEVYAYLTTHQLLRAFQARAAAERQVAPRQVSFTEILTQVTHSIIRRTGVAADRAAGESARARRQATTRRRLLDSTNRPRSYPRTRKRPVSPYPSNRPGQRLPSPKVHHKITLTVRPER